MTIHKITAGDGYVYLTRQVAGGDVPRQRGQDAASYYAAKGNPPGRWQGRGAALLDLTGKEVTEEQMRALYGAGMHPDADRVMHDYLAAHVRAGMTPRQRQAVQAAAIRAATLGQRFPVYSPVAPFTARVDQRITAIETETGRPATVAEVRRVQAEESRRARAAVAGFDVVFAPVKSAALLWALHPDPAVRSAVRHAHEAARDAALDQLEQHAAFTRTGKDGVAQIETRGLIYAIFDHYDSRAGDPNLHTHVAISSKVQGIDGKWRSLDARGLYRVTVAVSEFYNTAFETQLRARLPVTFTPRADTADNREPVREITGMPHEFITHFSSRRTAIEARYQQLLREYRREHGHDPSRAMTHRLARRANLDTRQDKTLRSLEEMRADWTRSLTDTFGADAVARLAAAVPDHRATLTPAAERGPAPDVAELAARVVTNVAQLRSSWTVWNLRAEAERLARTELTLTSPEQHQAIVTEIVEAAAGPAHCVRVDAPALLDEPPILRRSGGESVFAEHAAARYTSRAILAAEDRLVAAAKTSTAVALAGPQVAAALKGFDAQTARDDGARLDAGQRQLVTRFATDERLLVAGLGPAGTGKTTAMRAYAHVAAQAGQRIVALATSAAAADLLGKELGVNADNLHKFLHEYTRGRYSMQLRSGQRVPVWVRAFALRPGDVVLLDEAGMAGTLQLGQLVQIASRRGAIVRLLGDHQQLGAVESGGALRLIAAEAGAAELDTLYRFTDPREADATLKLRDGDSTGLDFYTREGRIRSGSKQAMLESAYQGWKTDMFAGKTSLMAAATNTSVTELAAQARRDRIDAGQVEPDGVRLHDGNLAGKGDWILTRRNDRTLRVHRGRDWVKNGDAWRVVRRHRDGSLTVTHLEHSGRITLPTGYVAEHVELLYATTGQRAQGSTVDTAHPLITAEMSRENLYVIATRARERTTLHVVIHELPGFDPDTHVDQIKTDARQYAAREVLTNILNREGNELSATEAIRASADDAASLAVLVPRYEHAAAMLATGVYTSLAHRVLPRPLAEALAGCEGWGQTVAALTRAERHGWPAELLLATARDGDLAGLETPGRLLAWRIDQHLKTHPAPGPLAVPSLADTRRYARLLRPYAQGVHLDPAAALRAPALLSPTRSTGPRVSSRTLTHYSQTVAAALDLPSAEVIAHRAWPHLAGALATADQAGYDLTQLLSTAIPASSQNPQSRDQSQDMRIATVSRTVRKLLDAGPVTIPPPLRPRVTATAALGPETAVRLAAEPSWPALAAALRRAEHAGHDGREMLARVAHARDYEGARSGSQVLAWRLTRYLRTQPPPTPTSDERRREGTDWRLLAWRFKALERHGIDVADVLPAATAATLNDVCEHARQTANAPTTRPEAERSPLPWLTGISSNSATGHELLPYLEEARRLITDRVEQLTEQTSTERPAWTALLGTPPAAPTTYAEWVAHLGVIAAYRDQHRIRTSDPVQILGPYPERARAEHAAYEHAATSVLAARRLAGLQSGPGRPDPDVTRVAADILLALPEDEQEAVHAAVTVRTGGLSLGDATVLADVAPFDDATAGHLEQVLAERGHLELAEHPRPPHPAGEDSRGGAVRERPLEADHAAHREQQRDAERAERQESARRAQLHRQARDAARQRRATHRGQEPATQDTALTGPETGQQRDMRRDRQLDM